ncbi:DUF3693 domain-containing protein [Vibrio ostreicida]|uniref:DUF3693 domain-containing protein n=1 Tax=Vibrio ostreicida TaxID=526588 RepID=UPI003B5A9408
MYANELLDAYKKANNYIQDKQIAHDLALTPQQLHKIRKGIRYVSDEEAIVLAKGAAIDPELALLGCHADRNENPNIKAMWNNIAKKYNGLGFQGLSIACGGLAMWIGSPSESLARCALCGSLLC